MSALEKQLQCSSERRGPDEPDDAYDSRLTDITTNLKSLGTLGDIAQLHLLQGLNPAADTLAYLTVLSAVVDRGPKASSTSSHAEVLPFVSQFLNECDPIQIRYAGHQWRQLFVWTADLAASTQNPHLLIVLRNALLRMDPTSATLTSNHLLFLHACLGLGLPRQALPVLNKSYHCLPRSSRPKLDTVLLCARHDLSCEFINTQSAISGPIGILDVQEYHLLEANIYTGLRNYTRADLALRMVLGVPVQNNAISPLSVEAYKKLQLVSLLYNDTRYTPEAGVQQASSNQNPAGLRSTLSMLSKPYEALANSFVKRDHKRYEAERIVAGSLWSADGNQGLVEEASRALLRHRIRDLQDIYLALSLSKVADHVSLSVSDTQTLLNTMIATSELNATLSTSTSSDVTTSILRFTANQQTPSPAAQAVALKAQTARLDSLTRSIAEVDRRLDLSKDYRDSFRRGGAAARASERGGGGLGFGSGLGMPDAAGSHNSASSSFQNFDFSNGAGGPGEGAFLPASMAAAPGMEFLSGGGGGGAAGGAAHGVAPHEWFDDGADAMGFAGAGFDFASGGGGGGVVYDDDDDDEDEDLMAA